jgi:putative addiction module component (TIGR02574 family)
MGSKKRQRGDTVATQLPDITETALKLPAEQRAQLARQLLASLARDPDIEAAWDDEIERRLDAWKTGLVKEVPWEEVRVQARGRLEGK